MSDSLYFVLLIHRVIELELTVATRSLYNRLKVDAHFGSRIPAIIGNVTHDANHLRALVIGGEKKQIMTAALIRVLPVGRL